MEVGFGAAMLLFWQRAVEKDRRWPRLAGLAFCEGAAVSSHYFAVLLLAPLAIGELVRTLRNRRIDFGVWAAFAAGLSPLIANIPLLQATAVYKKGFWAHPTLHSFLGCYALLITPRHSGWMADACCDLYGRRCGGGDRGPIAPESKGSTEFVVPVHEWAALGGFLLLPVFQLAISPLTQVMVARYTCGIVIGASILGI